MYQENIRILAPLRGASASSRRPASSASASLGETGRAQRGERVETGSEPQGMADPPLPRTSPAISDSRSEFLLDPGNHSNASSTEFTNPKSHILGFP